MFPILMRITGTEILPNLRFLKIIKKYRMKNTQIKDMDSWKEFILYKIIEL
jgi:hypothetical protein